MRCPVSSFGDPAWSWLWSPFSWMFSLARAFTFWAGCDLALPLTSLSNRECLFATFPAVVCSSCTLVKNQHWASLCPIRQHLLQNPPNFRLFTTLWVEIRVVYAMFPLPFVPLLFPKLYGTPLRCPPFTGPLPAGAMNPA